MELAFVVIFLLIMFAGMVIFGRAFWYLDALTKATRDGARYMSMQNLSGAANASAAEAAAKDLVVSSANAASLHPALAAAQVTVNCDGEACSGTVPGRVSVAIAGYSIGYAGGGDVLQSVGGSGGDFGPVLQLAPQTTMRYMR